MYIIRLMISIGLILIFAAALSANYQQEHDIRFRRDEQNSSDMDDSSGFEENDVGWTNINEEVDVVTPMVLQHLHTLGIEHLKLPDMKESLSVKPLFITYEASLLLTNGIVYNLSVIRRNGTALMTYKGKSFLCRFYLRINELQFEYNFMLKVMAIEGYGKVIGSLDDTIIYAELAVNVINSKLHLHDFRIIEFRNIHVQLDQTRLIRQLTGIILSPITNLFKDRITTSIADGLKEQMQMIMDDFNNKDPLELRKFTKKLLSGISGSTDEIIS
ncbi:uncharacterized protein LOC115621344 [Scaptodrosophila lebanonensis]|uniref:Uncharacterized protein LOC115621344 n=1 Tax=Drosophila lebanonensis TaxID=7225 RepID=A0A6J2T6T0_DROLE|nr:uncharacterized protein LOC115621344 [Scaptodrosophila lebanonensis]XP_030370824.1 uncharacterized protein LOC115621344 [Scaptodrosophila lebanonensis]